MLSFRLLHPRWFRPGGRLGVGAGLSAVAHVGCLALLLVVVTRGGRSPLDGDGGEGDRVDVTTVGEPGPAGDSDRETGKPASPASERPRRVTVAPPRPRTATGVVARPAPASGGPARPVARSLATRTPGSTGTEPPLVPGRAGSAGPSQMAAFRAELKQRMRAAWRAREVYQRVDPQGRLQGTLLITSLNVRLRSDGTVEKAVMHDSSGIAALDTEAASAIQRMKPLSRLPKEIVDQEGGLSVRCAFHLDLGLFRFANQLHRVIAEEWNPGRAFMSSGDRERVTVVLLMIDRQGVLLQSALIQSAGIDFLDKNATVWARPGMHLAAPPSNFMRGRDRVPVYLAFAHLSGRFIVRDPEEDLETE